jgi:aminopeptidase N
MTSGLNTLRLRWACENAKLARLEAEQGAPKDNPTLREHRTRVAFLASAPGGKIKVASSWPMTYDGDRSEMLLTEPVACPEGVYPNHEDHDYAKVVLDAKTLELARTRLAQVEEPLLRNMMSDSLWSMVRDAEWDLGSYLKTIYAYLPQEKNERNADAVLGALVSASGYLTRALQQAKDERAAREIRAKKNVLENFVLQRLRAAAAASDAQADTFFAFVKVSESPSSQALMREWLAGRSLPKGLSLGQDRQWSLVKRLNRLGVADGEKLIATQLEKEDNDYARKAVIAARALRPDTVLKKELWERLVNGKDTLDDQKQIFWNLFPSEQLELQKDWVEPFYRDLVALAATKDEDYLGHFAESLVPTSCTPESSARLAAFLKKQGRKLAPSVQKELKIALQEDERCVKIVQNFASTSI